VKGSDGYNQIGPLVTLGGLSIPNLEVYEATYPIQVLRCEFRMDGGGPGQWRGGSGIDYECELTEPTQIIWRGEGFYSPSGYGMSGGREGLPAEGWIYPSPTDSELPQYGQWELVSGARLWIKSAGGGGWGDPRKRARSTVIADVRNGFVSSIAAKEDYGIEILEGEMALGDE
jgi:N-methylhydantoinase B